MSCVVYWLHDDKCVCPWKHGYVGISERWTRRLWHHRRNKRFPIFDWKILYEGTRGDCLVLEAKLRPTHSIGWNWFEGGRAGGTAPKSPEHREKISAATKRRYADPKEREKTINAVKKAFEVIDRSGANNVRYGVKMSDETKKRISAARMGKGRGNQNWKKRKPYSAAARLKMSEGSKRRWKLNSACDAQS